jgi:hypothetical protein
MLIFRINLTILILSNMLLLAASDEEKLENRLSFDLRRRFMWCPNKEHLLLTGKNTANISTNDSIFNIHFRYSIHDNRLVIMDSKDNHELYKVMCNLDLNCRILQDGMELMRLDPSMIRATPNEIIDSRRSINIGNNWTMLVVPDERKVMLFHAAYSNQQPLVELTPFKIFYPSVFTPTYSLHIVQQSLFEPAFLIAMALMIDDF